MIFNLRRLLSQTIISNLDLSHGLGESVIAGTALFFTAHERLNNINWGDV